LDGLGAQTLQPPEVELVLVDNGSTDGSQALLEEWASSGPGRITVRVEQNHGVAPARNLGLQKASAPIVAFTDDDCVPDDRWLERGLAAMDRPDVAVVQGATSPDPTVPLGRWPRTQEITGLTGFFETCNVFYRRDALLAAGGFDETLGWFGEDVAAAWSVLRRGGRAEFASDAQVVHAVTHPGFRAFLGYARHYTNWPAVVRQCPELRDTALWRRWFLRERSAELLALVLGAGALAASALTGRRGLAALGLVLAAPGLRRRVPRHADRAAWIDAALLTVFDVAVEAALVEGSIRHRTLVL